EQVAVAQMKTDSLGELPEQRVADGMAVIVVDVLEIVNVEKDDRKSVGIVGSQELADAVFDQPSRRKSGQLVVVGKTIEFALAHLLRRHVDRAGQQQRPLRHLERIVR